uniref:RNase H type-1 domain-containing protein n=1 Tax=Fagus sylvatica TaxID=28930 RepID=A0A2N9GBJ0_FAGSY
MHFSCTPLIGRAHALLSLAELIMHFSCNNQAKPIRALVARILKPLEQSIAKSGVFWNSPPISKIKLNVDAAMKNNEATIAVVARNADGYVLTSCPKKIKVDDPCIAEAAAIAWAVEIAKAENFMDIMVEGDTKVCIDAVAGATDKPPWRIQSFVDDIAILIVKFNSCCFCWVGRDANSMKNKMQRPITDLKVDTAKKESRENIKKARREKSSTTTLDLLKKSLEKEKSKLQQWLQQKKRNRDDVSEEKKSTSSSADRVEKDVAEASWELAFSHVKLGNEEEHGKKKRRLSSSRPLKGQRNWSKQ